MSNEACRQIARHDRDMHGRITHQHAPASISRHCCPDMKRRACEEERCVASRIRTGLRGWTGVRTNWVEWGTLKTTSSLCACPSAASLSAMRRAWSRPCQSTGPIGLQPLDIDPRIHPFILAPPSDANLGDGTSPVHLCRAFRAAWLWDAGNAPAGRSGLR